MSTARKVSAAQFEEQPGALLRRARQGEVIHITVNGRTVARLEPMEETDSSAFVDEVMRIRAEEDLSGFDAEQLNPSRKVEPPRPLDL